MKVIWLVLLQIISGVTLTITVKYMYKIEEEGVIFDQVYLQCMVSFLGQMFNFVVYILTSSSDKDNRSAEYSSIKKSSRFIMGLRLMVPAVFHLLCQMCGFAAYMNINASLAMMIGSILPLVTALLSRIFLAIKIQRMQYHGMVVIIFGSLLINTYALLSSNTDQNPNNNNGSNIYGIFFSNLSVLFFGLLIISEEICLKVYKLDSTLIAGFEGAAALVISLLCIPSVNYIKPGLVDVDLFFKFFRNNPHFGWSCLVLLLTDMVYTLMCIMVTKNLTGLYRAIIYQFRITGVWVVTLFLNNPLYLGGGKWEIFSYIQLIGYILLLLGVFIFNGFIKLPNIIHKKITTPQHLLLTPLNQPGKVSKFNFQLTPQIK